MKNNKKKNKRKFLPQSSTKKEFPKKKIIFF